LVSFVVEPKSVLRGHASVRIGVLDKRAKLVWAWYAVREGIRFRTRGVVGIEKGEEEEEREEARAGRTM
jgi:hypothetical protein